MMKTYYATLAATVAFGLAGATLAQVSPAPIDADLAVYARPQRLVTLPDDA